MRAILGNPRCTGYQVWGRRRRDEVLLDVEDVAAGHTSRRRWSPANQWVWSAEPAHPALVSRETFQAVQARMHTVPPSKPRKARPYDDPLPGIDAWLAGWATPSTWRRPARRSRPPATSGPPAAPSRRLLADRDRRLARYRAALEAGTDPAVVGQGTAEVTATRQAAEASLRVLEAAPAPVSPAAVRAALGEVGGLAAALDGADPGLRAQPYEELGIQGTYDPNARTVQGSAESL